MFGQIFRPHSLLKLDIDTILSKLFGETSTLCKNNRVTLTRLPGYIGIQGNETTDELEKKGTRFKTVGISSATGKTNI